MTDRIVRPSPVPLYKQARAIIIGRIDRGVYRTRLPSTDALARELGVSRGTARKALQLLGDEGRIAITSGWGTFVRR